MPPLNPRKRWWADSSPDDTILARDASPLVRAGASNVRDTYQPLLAGRQGSRPVPSILSSVSQYQRRISGSACAPSTPQYLSKPSVGLTSPLHSTRKRIRVARSILPTTPPSNLENLQGYQSQLSSVEENRSINSVNHAEQGPTQGRCTQANRVNLPSNAISARKWKPGSVHPLEQLSPSEKQFFNSTENNPPTLLPVGHVKLLPRSPKPVLGSQKGMMGFGKSRAKGSIPTISSVDKDEAYGNPTMSPLPQIIFHDCEPLFVAPIQPMLRNYTDNVSLLLPGSSQIGKKGSFAVVIPVPSRSITQHAPAATDPCCKIGTAVLRQPQTGSRSTGFCRRSPRLNLEKSDPKFQTLAAENNSAVGTIIPSSHIPVPENHEPPLLSPETPTTSLKRPRSNIKSLTFRKKTVGAANRTDNTSPRPLFEITTNCSEREADLQKRKDIFEVVIWSRPQSEAKAQEGHSALNVPDQPQPKTPPARLQGLTYERMVPKELETIYFAQTAEDKKIPVPAVPAGRHRGPQVVGGSDFRWQFNMPNSSQEAQNRFITSAGASTKNQGPTTSWIPRQRRIENSPFRGLKIVTATATPPMGPLGRLPIGSKRLLMTPSHRQVTSNSYLRTPTISRPRGAASLRARRSGRSALPNTPRPIIVPLAWSTRSNAAVASTASPEVSPSVRKQRSPEGVRDRALEDLAQNCQGNPSFNGDAGSSKTN